MKRLVSRLAVAGAGAMLMVASTALVSPPAQAQPTVNANGWWFCVANQQLDVGYCQGNPLPTFGPIYLP